MNRESYLVAASACFAKDEDGNQVLKVLLPFVEHSNGRKLKLFFYPGGRAELRLSETPDPEELLRDLGLLSDSRVVLWLGRLAAREDGELGEYAIRRTVEPPVPGAAGGRSPKNVKGKRAPGEGLFFVWDFPKSGGSGRQEFFSRGVSIPRGSVV